jgi:hypothetical protein
MPPDIDHDGTDDPVCPHCGKADRDWWDGLSAKDHDRGYWTAQCGWCEKFYVVHLTTILRFSTEEVDA